MTMKKYIFPITNAESLASIGSLMQAAATSLGDGGGVVDEITQGSTSGDDFNPM